MIDSPATPGGCWTHFSHVVMRGYRSLQAAANRCADGDWQVCG
ncbi:hypothetical protein [Haloactinomyces albus]|uniref:Uncharacterized protein n=1 Tax=Haloactinomyces albus TaxID=1352928 RepID=A0AAE4CMC6_9ACTN|nr:hypothetical protein [Haloactinomyces albus]MDR7303220.1 hypothetical protein [Haloactinomyces albus]